MVRDTGVDLMTFGLTKDGAMYGETVVFLRPELAERAAFVRKQAGQLPSKARFVAAQVLALLDGDLWLRNADPRQRHGGRAGRARSAASRACGRRAAAGGQLGLRRRSRPRPSSRCSEWSFFWEWDLTVSLVRWMTSFATTDEDIDRFAAGVRAIVADHRGAR